MTSGRYTLLVGLFLVAGLATTCGSGGIERRADLERVIAEGRRAVLEKKPAAVCRLLTPKARRLVLRFGVDWNGGLGPISAPSRRPRTCVALVRGQTRFAEIDYGGFPWLADLRKGPVTSLSGKRGRARATFRPQKPRGGTFRVDFILTPDGWRADSSPDLPALGTGE